MIGVLPDADSPPPPVDPESADPAARRAPARPAGPPSDLARNLVVGGAIGFFILALIGDTFLAALVDRHPALFIALNARNRNLILAKDNLDWWSFFGIATVRLLISDPLFFLLGRWYGDAGVRWIEKRSPTYGPLARGAEKWFGKASYPLIVIAPNNYICLFAGAGGMGVGVFFLLNLVGTLGRLTVLWWVGDVADGPLDAVRGFITDNRLLVFAVSLGLVGLSMFFDRKAGGTEIGGLLHIEEEIADLREAEEREAEAEATRGAVPDAEATPPTAEDPVTGSSSEVRDPDR